MICEAPAARARHNTASPAGRPISRPSFGTGTVLVGPLPAESRSRLLQLLAALTTPTVEVSAADELPHLVGQEPAACLLIEPGPAALHLAPWLSAAGPAVPVLCYAGQPTIAAAVRALRAGAWTYQEHTVADHDLLAEIRQALDEAARRQCDRQRLRDLRARFAVLSPREREVFVCTTDGDSIRRIGARLGISPRTVEAHRANGLAKLGVDRFCEVAYDFCTMLAYEEGFARSENTSAAASSRPTVLATEAAQTLIACGHCDTI